ncbi:MAG: hypothetical protein P4L84_11215 [Isosphaeraceae bacterium]|nr:hypothetical protein [Isosphaeraceae bacterium]
MRRLGSWLADRGILPSRWMTTINHPTDGEHHYGPFASREEAEEFGHARARRRVGSWSRAAVLERPERR